MELKEDKVWVIWLLAFLATEVCYIYRSSAIAVIVFNVNT